MMKAKNINIVDKNKVIFNFCDNKDNFTICLDKNECWHIARDRMRDAIVRFTSKKPGETAFSFCKRSKELFVRQTGVEFQGDILYV